MCQSDIVTESLGIGAGIGGGFQHSSELKSLNCKKAMASTDRIEWKRRLRKNNIA